ncbi:MAG TPA: TonB-dependent receptor [Novosphingobium sp.]
MRAFKKTLLLSAALGCGIAAVPAFAQADDGASTGDIIVTARRVEERLQDVPISIAVFNQEQLSNRNVFNPVDLATYTPSLSTNQRFGAERSSFAIRGFTQEIGTAPSVAVYFADVVAPRGASLSTSGGGAGAGAFFDLQNVQVLKGPQGTLFGRNTTGGAILLVPRKPTDRLEGYVEGSIGNYDMRRVQAVINVPLSDTFKVRLGIDRNKRDGYLKNFSGVGPADFNDTDYIALRGSVVANLAPNLENYTIVTYSKSDTNGNNFQLINCNRTPTSGLTPVTAPLACAQFDRQQARGPYSVESSIPNPYQHIEQFQIINTTTWEASDNLTIKNIASYAQFRDSTNQSFLGENLVRPGDTGGAYSFIIVGPGFGGNLTNQETFTEEFQLQGSTADNRLTWQAGAYLELSNPLRPASQRQRTFLRCADAEALRCDPLVPAAPGTAVGRISGSITLPTQGIRFRNFGFYAQGTYSITEQLRLTAGIRYTNDRAQATAENLTIAFPASNSPIIVCQANPDGPRLASVNDRGVCRQSFTAKSEKPTWLINLDYKPTEDILLYAKYARGYRAGGVNPSAVAFEEWQPEKVESYEVGAKTSFDGAVRGSFNVAGFYNDLTNQQLQATLVAARQVQGILNAGKSRIWGAEVEAMIEPVSGLRFEGSYTYLNTRVQRIATPSLVGTPYTGINLTTFQGDPLTLSPRHKFTITGAYTLPLDESIGDITFAATYSWTDSMLATRATPRPESQILPSVGLLNLNINWNSVGGSPVDLALFATNVTKEVVRTYTGAGWNSAGFDATGRAEPRMYGVRLKYRFGN